MDPQEWMLPLTRIWSDIGLSRHDRKGRIVEAKIEVDRLGVRERRDPSLAGQSGRGKQVVGTREREVHSGSLGLCAEHAAMRGFCAGLDLESLTLENESCGRVDLN